MKELSKKLNHLTSPKCLRVFYFVLTNLQKNKKKPNKHKNNKSFTLEEKCCMGRVDEHKKRVKQKERDTLK